MKGLVLRDFRSTATSLSRALLILVCIVAVDPVACRRSMDAKDVVSVHLNISPQPVRKGTATVTIQLADLSGMPISRAHINVEGDMSHPGMAPVFAEADETAPGNYQTRLDLNMPGDWVVLLHIRLENGRKVERQIDVRGVEPN